MEDYRLFVFVAGQGYSEEPCSLYYSPLAAFSDYLIALDVCRGLGNSAFLVATDGSERTIY